MALEKGNIVYIYNQTLGGRFLFEGEAVVKRVINATDHLAKVQFLLKKGDEPGRLDKSLYDRFVDPAGQYVTSPADYVEYLNGRKPEPVPCP